MDESCEESGRHIVDIINYKPIGIIHSPFRSIENVPIQPWAADGIRGTIEVFSEFVAGLQDLDGFSHIVLLYHLHLVTEYRLRVVPFLDRQERGLFATRAPCRPNPIGLSIVKLVAVQGTTLEIENVDIVDGTPLLDIKPYVPTFDNREVERIGWVGNASLEKKRADGRFGQRKEEVQ